MLRNNFFIHECREESAGRINWRRVAFNSRFHLSFRRYIISRRWSFSKKLVSMASGDVKEGASSMWPLKATIIIIINITVVDGKQNGFRLQNRPATGFRWPRTYANKKRFWERGKCHKASEYESARSCCAYEWRALSIIESNLVRPVFRWNVNYLERKPFVSKSLFSCISVRFNGTSIGKSM